MDARELLEDGRQRNADGPAQRINGVAGRGAQQRPASVLLDFDLAEVEKIIDDVLPFRHGETSRRQPVHQLLAQHQGEEGAEDVATDGGVGAMENRPRGEQRLGGEKALLHRQQVAVAQHDLQGRQPGVGAQHEQPVVGGIRLDPGRIDGEAAAGGLGQEAAVAAIADQRLVALCQFALRHST